MNESATTPLSSAPQEAPRWFQVASPLRFVRWSISRPRRVVLLLISFAILAFAGIVGWREATFRLQLRSARTEVAKGHNAGSVRPLQICRAIHPDHAETLLLCACVARRSGSETVEEGISAKKAEEVIGKPIKT